MAIATNSGIFYWNTSNKSELSTGYGTLTVIWPAGSACWAIATNYKYTRWLIILTVTAKQFRKTLSIRFQGAN